MVSLWECITDAHAQITHTHTHTHKANPVNSVRAHAHAVPLIVQRACVCVRVCVCVCACVCVCDNMHAYLWSSSFISDKKVLVSLFSAKQHGATGHACSIIC